MWKKELLNAIKVSGLEQNDTAQKTTSLIGQSNEKNLSNVIDLFDIEVSDNNDKLNLEMYSAPASKEIYRNFLDWLFKTFNQNELDFRKKLIEKLLLKEGDKVLITSCGFGDDIQIVLEKIGLEGQVHAQDLSREMVNSAALENQSPNVLLTISNALDLPYEDRYFDAVFHFGGINLFGEIDLAISEMERVCKVGGKVVFGDEGVAAHLKKTEFGQIATTNISVWELDAPMEHLPVNCDEIELTYVLGNCFYIIAFSPRDELPYMNIDVEHKGVRGGTARSRYYGQVEGVTKEAQDKIYQLARDKNTSAHKLLSEVIMNMDLD